jgi:hypothetical protein
MKKNYSSGSRTSFWRKIAARNWRRRAQKLFIYPLIFDFDRFCLYFRSIGRRNVCCSCFNFGYTLGVFRRCNFVFVSQRRYYFGSGHPHLLPHSLSFMMGALEYYISSHLCYGDGKVHHESAERVLGIRLYHLFFYTACFCERRDETERHKERELLFVCHVYSISILHIVEHELMQGKISLDTLLDVLTMHDLCNFECRL